MAGFWEKEVLELSMQQFGINLIYAAVLIILGILLGRLIHFVFKRAVEKGRMQKTLQNSFIHLFLTVIKWSVYLLFVNLAIVALGIPQFTKWLSDILVVIPALVGALLLIGGGFAIATYLKDLVEESRIEGWKILSKILFFFVLYVFLVFAFKTALISFERTTVDYLLIIFSAIAAASLGYWYARQK